MEENKLKSLDIYRKLLDDEQVIESDELIFLGNMLRICKHLLLCRDKRIQYEQLIPFYKEDISKNEIYNLINEIQKSFPNFNNPFHTFIKCKVLELKLGNDTFTIKEREMFYNLYKKYKEFNSGRNETIEDENITDTYFTYYVDCCLENKISINSNTSVKIAESQLKGNLWWCKITKALTKAVMSSLTISKNDYVNHIELLGPYYNDIKKNNPDLKDKDIKLFNLVCLPFDYDTEIRKMQDRTLISEKWIKPLIGKPDLVIKYWDKFNWYRMPEKYYTQLVKDYISIDISKAEYDKYTSLYPISTKIEPSVKKEYDEIMLIRITRYLYNKNIKIDLGELGGCFSTFADHCRNINLESVAKAFEMTFPLADKIGIIIFSILCQLKFYLLYKEHLHKYNMLQKERLYFDKYKLNSRYKNEDILYTFSFRMSNTGKITWEKFYNTSPSSLTGKNLIEAFNNYALRSKDKIFKVIKETFKEYVEEHNIIIPEDNIYYELLR